MREDEDRNETEQKKVHKLVQWTANQSIVRQTKKIYQNNWYQFYSNENMLKKTAIIFFRKQTNKNVVHRFVLELGFGKSDGNLVNKSIFVIISFGYIFFESLYDFEFGSVSTFKWCRPIAGHQYLVNGSIMKKKKQTNGTFSFSPVV